MAQITTGVRNFLSSPLIYNWFQKLVGSKKFRHLYIRDYVEPGPKCKILDIGCGTGEILEHLPITVDYHGYDMSHEYIRAAQMRYGVRGHWFCASVADMEVDDYGTFDIVMANGVLHHLSDDEAKQLAELAAKALKPGGRFCSFDGCFVPKQNPIARFLISKDRGRNVRNSVDYLRIIMQFFVAAELFVRGDMLHIPYTHAIVVARK